MKIERLERKKKEEILEAIKPKDLTRIAKIG
jgi:hypothetical protein